jgi:DNA-directed RNA polymerase specialized sigma subunit
MSEDHFFTQFQKAAIKRMINEVVDGVRSEFQMKIDRLSAELNDLKTDRERRERILREKESFTVKDVAELMNIKAETVRKNYIHTGIIEAESVPGKPSVISKAEYWRVASDLEKYGEVTADRTRN